MTPPGAGHRAPSEVDIEAAALGAAASPRYAGVPRRFLARLVDGLITAALVTGASVALSETVEIDAVYVPLRLGGALTAALPVAPLALQLGIGWVYWALLEALPAGATLGKLLLGCRVTSAAGRRASFLRTSVRYWVPLLFFVAAPLAAGLYIDEDTVVSLVSVGALLVGTVGYVLAAFTPHKQALHDLLAGTVVVRRGGSTVARATSATNVERASAESQAVQLSQPSQAARAARYCAQCGAALGEGARFCANCGAPAAQGAMAPAPAEPVASPPPTPAPAPAAVSMAAPVAASVVAPAAPFVPAAREPEPVTVVAAPETVAEPEAAADAAPVPPRSGMARAWHFVTQEPTGLAMAALVFLVGALLCLVLWNQMAAPARGLTPFTPVATCANLPLNSFALSFCAFENGILSSFSTFAIVAILAFIRWPLNWVMARLLPRLPLTVGHGLAALLATLMFGITWAGAHHRALYQPALLPQPVFPAVIGLFTYATLRWAPPLLARLDWPLRARDRIPVWGRIVLGAALPVLFTLLVLNRFTPQINPPPVIMGRNEQISTLFALLASFLLMAPRLSALPDEDLSEYVPLEELEARAPAADGRADLTLAGAGPRRG